MKIGVEMFGSQELNRGRGIGRYTRELVRQLLSRFPRHHYVLYYHEGLPGADDPWPGTPEIRVLQRPASLAAPRGVSDLLTRDNPDGLDALLLSCAFNCHQNHLPPPRTPPGPKVAAILYDLIPALFQSQYLTNEVVSRSYHAALLIARRYDRLLAISAASRRDGIRVLAVPEDRVVNVGTGGDGSFFHPDRGAMPAATAATLAAHGVREPFVFSVSADDHRKNLKGLLLAFQRLPDELRRSHQLLVTCAMEEHRRDGWRRFARELGILDRLVLLDAWPSTPGYVGDEAMRVFYQRCSAFAFPSLYEGFGLPILEALQCGAPVIAGRNSSQPEVVGDRGLLANADDPADFSAALTRVLSDARLSAALREEGPRWAARFTWESVADRAMAAIEEMLDERPGPTSFGAVERGPAPDEPRSSPASRRGAPTPKPRIAFFSPLAPLRSGVADYSERLLESLRDHYAIDLYHDAGYVPHAALAVERGPCHDFRLFDRENQDRGYAGIVYQMCNSEVCGYIYETLRRFPGLVVMHDYALPEFHVWYANQKRMPLARLLAQELTLENAAAARELQASYAGWSAGAGGICQALLSRGLTLNRRILDHAASVLVHDDWGAARLRRDVPELAERLFVAPLGADARPDPSESRASIKSRLGFPGDALIFGCYGFINGMKYHAETMDAFSAVWKDFPSAQLLFVGADCTQGQARAHAAALGVRHRVHFYGYASSDDFRELMAITDVALNLRRPPTRGETSAALLTLLGAGVPTIITAVDAFTSYPDSIVRKVPPLSPGDRALERAMRELAADAPARRRLGQAAREYVAAKHDWSKAAARYAEAIEWTRENRRRWAPMIGQKTRAAAARPGTGRRPSQAPCQAPSVEPERERMKVMVLSNLYPPDVIGGYELCCRQMVEGLRGRGHQVTVFTTAPRQPCAAEARVERCFHFANFLDFYSRRRDAPAARALLDAESRFVQAANVHLLLAALEREKPDVVYLWNLLGLGGLAMVATLCHLGVPWVWHLEDRVPRDLCSMPHHPLPLVAAEYSRAIRGHYLAVSRRTVEEIEDAGVKLADHVEYVPNWVVGPRPAERQRFYRGGTLRLVTAGYLAHFKGTELLIEMARLLLARGERRFELDIYGAGPYARFYRLIEQNGVGGHVHLRGELRQEELLSRYAQNDYDMFLFPTYSREPFGCAPLEAASHGIVMLMSQSCGIGEWFVDGIHCLKAERSAAAFADRIQDVLRRRIDLAGIGRLAAATIWNDFHVDAALGRVERAFESAVARRAPARGSPESAYRLALLAEKLTRAWAQNAYDTAPSTARP